MMYYAAPNVLPPTNRVAFYVEGEMKILRLAILAFSPALQLTKAGTVEFIPKQILVKSKAHVSDSNFGKRLATHRTFLHSNLKHINIQIIKIPNENVDTVLNDLRNDPKIKF